MSDIVIRVENLGKKFTLRHQPQRTEYTTLRDTINSSFRTVGKRICGRHDTQLADNTREEFWALKNVSFEVRRGDKLGIIGPNGSGKSTLLKILSRITEPSVGTARIRGKVSSLLEVGTGFHPELTGRENIYLNASILGMTKNDTRKRFDEIVAFSEVEKFLDTPVKRYSSGMYVRLAFAVAAHLEPEILIIDEVLAVGDASFQKKCLGKMDDVARAGRTVLFVTHNMGVVQTLCRRGVLLSKGAMIADGTATEAVTAYLEFLEKASLRNLAERADRTGRGRVRLSGIEISTGESFGETTLATGRPARFVFYVTGKLPGLSCAFTIYDQLGQPVTYFDSTLHGLEDVVDEEAISRFVCVVEELLLIPGQYRINASLSCDGECEDDVKGAIFFRVEQGKVRARSISGEPGYGSVAIPHHWMVPASA
ncbi:ABC transporter ATP-binding protein [Methylocaldum sp.]|uniref:ABC transporter ATP-binding protein n=1 Tax=Methylocaldum sp. TaxID=1969727 RepID=UPI002D5D3F5D|nr:ABC transporter ATP-binding protein [Methylocaldum sp.]HYE35243.1 ABC transporter ATP-binding protein [Methylocaldum sp.]